MTGKSSEHDHGKRGKKRKRHGGYRGGGRPKGKTKKKRGNNWSARKKHITALRSQQMMTNKARNQMQRERERANAERERAKEAEDKYIALYNACGQHLDHDDIKKVVDNHLDPFRGRDRADLKMMEFQLLLNKVMC